MRKFFNVIPAKAGIYYLLALCFLSGCISVDEIDRNYEGLGALNKGVAPAAAKIIAQKMIMKTAESDYYRISYPDIKTGKLARQYPDYWFVIFGHNWLEPLSQNPYAGTYRDMLSKEYLVVINKKTGEVPFFGEWYPKRENDFDWVFDRHAYNRRDPLALPPGRQSKVLF